MLGNGTARQCLTWESNLTGSFGCRAPYLPLGAAAALAELSISTLSS